MRRHRTHAKCWDLVGPMLNFSSHTAAIGQPWRKMQGGAASQDKSDDDDDDDDDDAKNETGQEEEAAAPGFVSAEFMLVVDRVCRAAAVPSALVDVPAFEAAVRRSFKVDIGLINLGTRLCLCALVYAGNGTSTDVRSCSRGGRGGVSGAR